MTFVFSSRDMYGHTIHKAGASRSEQDRIIREVILGRMPFRATIKIQDSPISA